MQKDRRVFLDLGIAVVPWPSLIRLSFCILTSYFCLQIFCGLASGQDLSLSRPGSLDFANSPNGAREWIFTGLPFSSSGYATVGYDDNVFTQHTDRTGSVYDELGLNANVNVGNDRTQLTGTGTLGLVVYWRRPGSKVDPDCKFDLNFNHQFSEWTVATLDSILTYQAQPDVSSGVGILNEVGNYVYSQNRLSIGFQWSRRVATFTNYSLNAINYDSPTLGHFDDRIEQLISEEIRYLLRPTIVALLQYQFGYEDYLHESLNNSQTHSFLPGADFTPGLRLTFSFRAGAHRFEVEAEWRSAPRFPRIAFSLRPKTSSLFGCSSGELPTSTDAVSQQCNGAGSSGDQATGPRESAFPLLLGSFAHDRRL